MHARVFVCACVYAPKARVTYGLILTLYDWLNSYVILSAAQFHFMALAINVIDGHGLSNKMCRQLQLKKNQVMQY